MPKTVLVGLAEAAVRESTHRVERALVNSGYRRPIDRVVINLAPADLKKDAGGFDLPIALGLLLGSGQVAFDRPGNFAIVGELALTGETRPIKGVLAMALAAAAEGRDGLLVPAGQRRRGRRRRGTQRLSRSAASPRRSGSSPASSTSSPRPSTSTRSSSALAHARKTSSTSRARTTPSGPSLIAAAGGHNVLMIGPPGTGKTLLAKRLADDHAPADSRREPGNHADLHAPWACSGRASRSWPSGRSARRTTPSATPAWSAAAARRSRARSAWRIRESCSSTSCPSSTARRSRCCASRSKRARVTISRALRSTTFPAEFILVAAMNPCPCGYRADPRRACSCTPPQVEKYLSKISGPLLDRIDLHVEVPAVPFTQLAEAPPGPTSADLLEQVLEARARQAERFGSQGPGVNGRMTPRQVRKYCALKPEAMSILKARDGGARASRPGRTTRSCASPGRWPTSKARTTSSRQHIAEAVGYRSLDRSVWM